MFITFDAPDPEYAEAFSAFRNYFEDLAGWIGGNYGWSDTLTEGVHDAVLLHPAAAKVNRRNIGKQRLAEVDKALRQSWGVLRRAYRELEEEDEFDEEANAWLPVQVYYATFHGARAFGFASNQQVSNNHQGVLNMMGRTVERGLLPYPWSVACSGCPQTKSATFDGFDHIEDVHVLSRPDPATSESRLAMFLRTTREKELDRRFGEERTKKVAPGRTRRNLSRADKDRIAGRLAPTTLFDIFWRLRKKANYDDADTFVLGAAGSHDARRLGHALVIVADATVAALEALIAMHIGPEPVAELASAYGAKVGAKPGTGLGRHVSAWEKRVNTGADAPW
jgi:hypothetical protein